MANTKEGSAAPARTVYKTSTIEKNRVRHGRCRLRCRLCDHIQPSGLFLYQCGRCLRRSGRYDPAGFQDLRRRLRSDDGADHRQGQLPARQIQKLGPLDGHPLCSQCGPSGLRPGRELDRSAGRLYLHYLQPLHYSMLHGSESSLFFIGTHHDQ